MVTKSEGMNSKLVEVYSLLPGYFNISHVNSHIVNNTAS
jgi:hypothetical protein